MQFLAIMKVDPATPKEKLLSLQKQETVESWKMTKTNVLRSLWYIPGEDAPLGTVAILECADQKAAEAHCQQFPFVANGVVGIELMPLGPCTAYELLFAAPVD